MKLQDLTVTKTRKGTDSMAWYYAIEAPGATHLKVMLYYDLGGYNYFTSKQKERGYYVSIQPVSLSAVSESFSLFGQNSGGYIFLEPTRRFSRKRLAELEATCLDEVDEYANQLIVKLRSI